MSTADRELLSVEDARILALESGTVRGHTCKLFVIAEPRDVDRVREHIERRLGSEPRLRLRLADGSPPAWEPDPDFALERHVRDGGTVDEAGFTQRVGELIVELLPRDRPLWAIDVIAIGQDRTALVWRLHHALADGQTAMRMARSVIFDEREAPVSVPSDGGGAGVGAAAAEVAAASALVQAGDGGSPKPGHSRLAHLRKALHVPGALRRELARRGDATALDRPAGDRREVAFVDAPLDELKRIAHAMPEHVTINDVVLSAVAGGLRLWLERLEAHQNALRVKVPVSLHQPGDEVANRDSFIFVDLPLGESDPVARLLAIAAETRERKADHDAESLDAFFRDLSHLSSSLERFAEHWAESPRVFTLNVSNVPGPRGPLAVMGAPLESMHSLAEIGHRHALRIAVLSADGRIGFGLCADPDAVGGLEPIVEGIAAELEALKAAVAV